MIPLNRYLDFFSKLVTFEFLKMIQMGISLYNSSKTYLYQRGRATQRRKETFCRIITVNITIDVRRMSDDRLINLKIGSACKGWFYHIIKPVALKVAFRCLEIYDTFKFYITVFMTSDSIMQQLLRRNAYRKKQKHKCCCNTSYGLTLMQFLLPCCKSIYNFNKQETFWLIPLLLSC